MQGTDLGETGHESVASWYRLRHSDDFQLSSICYGSTRLSEREMEKRALRLRGHPSQFVAANRNPRRASSLVGGFAIGSK